MAKIPLGKHLNFNAVRKPKFKNKTYKTVKTFKDSVKAEEFLGDLKKSNQCSRRFPPFIEETSIGLRLGIIYRVCIPILK